jgi:LytR cell envelope-related transcriptional attenuator
MPQQQTAIIPPPRQPWYRRMLASPRYVVLVIAGVLVIGGAAAAGISNLSDDSGEGASPGTGNSSAPAANGDSGGGEPKQERAPVVPGNVTVAVLNGTTVPGLAKQVSDRVAAQGFQVGTVANTADQEQQRAESVVLFAPGHRNEARAVSRRMSINQRQPIDPGSQSLAGDATVVIIAGADLSQ